MKKKIRRTKPLMDKALEPKTSYSKRFLQKNKLKNLHGIIKCYTFATL
ncbi:hypothetical protein J2783_002877 [Chryseobacterium sediminis]|nr:hypothetical protein [Chryseobacterium sediminis]